MNQELAVLDMRHIFEIIRDINFNTYIPQVIVVKSNNCGQNIVRHRAKTGQDILYIENKDYTVLKELLMKEITHPQAKVIPAASWEENNINQDSYKLITTSILAIGDILRLKQMPQVFFCKGKDAASGENILFLPETYYNWNTANPNSLIEGFVILAHELRHIYQHQMNNNPSFFEGYINSPQNKDELAQYQNHPAERDAEAFALKLANFTFDNINLFEYAPDLLEEAQNINFICQQNFAPTINTLRNYLGIK